MRPRIKTTTRIGQLVGSTNPIQYECIKALKIEHHYNEMNFKRIRRVVTN